MDETLIADDVDVVEAQRARLAEIYTGVVKQRDKWVAHRAQSGVEHRWRVAQRLYEGKDPDGDDTSLAAVLKNGPTVPASGAQRSRVTINVVAPKVEASTARMCEILLPVDDKNWGFKPRPNHDLARDAQREGTLIDPATGAEVGKLSEIAQGVRKANQDSAEALENKVDDALTECNFNGAERRMIEDACRLGTGILKGPRPFNRCDCRYEHKPTPDGGMAFVESSEERTEPGSERIDPWNVFPDPACGNDHQRGAGIWEMRDITRRELRALIGVPGFDAEAIAEILIEDPKRVSAAEGRVTRTNSEDGSYQQWEYTGEVEARDFDFLREHAGSPVEKALAVEECVLLVVNDRIIGALPRLTRDLPYDFFTWWPRDDSPFGDGLPHRLENAQRVVTAAWRQLMDNAGLAAGSQLVINRHLVEPLNGKWEITPRKIWVAKDDGVADVSKAFTSVDFPAHIQELMAIVTAAMEMADRESNTPLLMQGDQGAAPDNVGGTLMLFNQANSPLRHRVKLFDDAVTEPHLQRYYRWFMDNGDEEGVKGDFEIDARGSTVLVERDAQNLAMMNIAKLAESPVYGPIMAPKALSGLRAILRSFRVNPDDWAPTEEEDAQNKKDAAKNGPPPPPPEIQAKQIEAQDRQAEREFKARENEADREAKREDRAYNVERENAEADIAMEQERTKRDVAFGKMANDRDISLRELQVETGIETMHDATARDLFNAEAALKQQTGQGI